MSATFAALCPTRTTSPRLSTALGGQVPSSLRIEEKEVISGDVMV